MLDKNSKIEQEEFNGVIDNFKKYDINLNKFINEIVETLLNYKKKLLIEKINVINFGKNSLIFSGYSKKYDKDIVIKIIPEFLKLFESESAAYKTLSHKYMCPIYTIDSKNKVIVMEKLDNTKRINFIENKKELEKFFDITSSNSTLCNNIFQIHYIEILNRYFKLLNIEFTEKIEKFYKKAIKRYEDSFIEEDLFIIHGNLHTKNILKNKHGYYAINPLGYASPKAFTFARFIITELFYTENTQEYFDILISFISKYSEYEKLINALYIDSILFLETLLLKEKDYKKYMKRVLNIIRLIEKNIESYEKNNNEKEDYNTTEIGQFVFGN